MQTHSSGRQTVMVLLLCAVAGCDGINPGEANRRTDRTFDQPSPRQVNNATQLDAHRHRAGSHGGTITTLGREEYHVEAVFQEDGMLRLYTLQADESRVCEVEQQVLTAYVSAENRSGASIVVLEPEPLPGDTPGQTSRFSGSLPVEFSESAVQVTIPNLRIGGDRFHMSFRRETNSHEPEMPVERTGAEANELYLVPGGKYTRGDIAANGNTTAAVKYRGFRAQHDLSPKQGDILCPITRTKANSDCTWVVGGLTYQFCCPPCIDEFVALAKSSPESLQPPDKFVQE